MEEILKRNRKWSAAEDVELLAGLESTPIGDLARRFDRTVGAIERRARKLGVKLPRKVGTSAIRPVGKVYTQTR